MPDAEGVVAVCPECGQQHPTVDQRNADEWLVRHVEDHRADEQGRTPSSERRPFCNTWPFASSDLDIALEEDNDRVHKARGCCDGFLPRLPITGRTPSQAEVLAWVAERWPEHVTVPWRAIKVGEEAGEILGAVIKADLGIKPRSAIRTETAQTVICAMALGRGRGLRPAGSRCRGVAGHGLSDLGEAR